MRNARSPHGTWEGFSSISRPENFISADKHVDCVSGVPCVFILKPYPLPFDMLFCLALGLHVSMFLLTFLI